MKRSLRIDVAMPWSNRQGGVERALLVMALGIACAACSNPENDYNAFVARTSAAASSQGDAATDAPPIQVEAGGLDGAFNDKNFVMACLSQLAPTAAEAALSVVQLQYTPADAGGGGTLQFSTASLAAASTNVNSPLASSMYGPFTATIASDGTGTITVGSQTLPAASNGVTMSQLVLSDVTFAFRLSSPTSICALLGGNLVSPLMVTLVPANNPCVIRSTDATGTWTPFAQADFHCP
jgi:hypothetical protein